MQYHKCPSYVHIQVLKSLGYASDWYRLEKAFIVIVHNNEIMGLFF